MKFCTVQLLLFVLYYTHYIHALTEAQVKAASKTLSRPCKIKTKVLPETIANMNKGIFDDNNHEAKCYLYCLMGVFKMLDADGNFDEASTMKQIDLLPESHKEASLKTLENCKALAQGSDKCEIAYNMARCSYFDNSENYFTP